jgi:hypothetical protein
MVAQESKNTQDRENDCAILLGENSDSLANHSKTTLKS